LMATQKQNLCRKKQKNPLISNVELAKQYGIGKSTVTDILNEKDQNAFSLWVNNALIINQDIDGAILKLKANSFAEKLNINNFNQSKDEKASTPSAESIANDHNEIEGGITNEEILKAVTDENEEENEPVNSEVIELEKVSSNEAEKAVNTILRFLLEQEAEFGEIEDEVRILRSLHRRIRLSFIKNLKQVELGHYFMN
ncbi:1524_t:CDS:2, partial [Racocetra persica]